MRKKLPVVYFLIFFCLLALMSMPRSATDSVRGSTVALLAPSWKQILAVKTLLSSSTAESTKQNSSEMQKLRLENAMLQREISHLKDVMQQEMRVVSKLSALASAEDRPITQLLTKRHKLELQKLLKTQLQAIPAKVIFRSPDAWNSSFWIDVGQQNNTTLGADIIVKNSPVLVGTSIVGIIDYVGEKQSRVRMITDGTLFPSVRALRGPSQNHLVCEKIYSLIQILEKKSISLPSSQEQANLVSALEKAAAQLTPKELGWKLAKGEIQGSGKPLWRTQRHVLKGIGFNYDFADGEGPARDLRHGIAIDAPNEPAIPILKAGDLLVTTGMDGVFPPDFLVGEVIKVHMLKEGDYYYELDALPSAGNLDELSAVFVIPPLGYDPLDQG